MLQLQQEVHPGPHINRLPTFSAPNGDPVCIRGADGYGTVDLAPTPEDPTRTIASRVAYAFATGEIWSIDARLLRDAKSSNYIPFGLNEWASLLSKYSDFLNDLKIPGPYNWIAGMEDVKGRVLLIGRGGNKSSPCTRDMIEVRGTHLPGDDPTKSLAPFIQQVYSSCRVRWIP